MSQIGDFLITTPPKYLLELLMSSNCTNWCRLLDYILLWLDLTFLLRQLVFSSLIPELMLQARAWKSRIGATTTKKFGLLAQK